MNKTNRQGSDVVNNLENKNHLTDHFFASMMIKLCDYRKEPCKLLNYSIYLSTDHQCTNIPVSLSRVFYS